MRRPFVTTLDGLRDARTLIVLYSGGLDSTHAVRRLAVGNRRIVACRVLLGCEDKQELLVGARNASKLGAQYVELDLVEEFAERFIAPAIRADARYHGVFPVCSSLSRPLIAEAAARLAKEIGADAVVHSSTWVQNSGSRYNRSLYASNPGLIIGNPCAADAIDRERKRDELAAAGVELRASSLHSIDMNLWGRVIEADSLDDPSRAVEDSVFEWARCTGLVKPLTITLGFDQGIPRTLNGTTMSLRSIVAWLNREAGSRGIGRFNGLEDTPSEFGGIKNHEVREAPAAAVILEARRHLELANLSQQELRAAANASWEWTQLVVNGWWHSPLREAYQGMIDRLSGLVFGEVTVVLGSGHAFVSAIQSSASPSYWNVHRDHEAALARLDMSALMSLTSTLARLRARHP